MSHTPRCLQHLHASHNECTRRTITWTQRCMSVRSPDDTGKTRRTDFASRQDFTLLAPSNVWKFCRPIFLKITISARRNENIITFYNGQLEKNCTIAKKYVNSKNLIRFKKVAIQNKCPAGNWDICFYCGTWNIRHNYRTVPRNAGHITCMWP